MGYAVVHLEKAKGSDSGMSAHIERTVAPKNADDSRTHLNQEMITFPNDVSNRTEAIQHRLDNAGLARKIGTNQVRAIRIMLTGTHENMVQIEGAGKLDKWCNDNLDWLRTTYGTENLVSVVLHLDEKTPHIHATVVPIVTTERTKRKREEVAKKKYRTKSSSAPRLCADEVMSRVALKGYQDSYAQVMAKYGLNRGIVGSEAKHISTSQHYRDLVLQSQDIQVDISKQSAKLAKVKADTSKEQFKNSAAGLGSKVLDGASSLFGTSRLARIEQENERLRADITGARHEIENVKQQAQKQFEEFKRKEQVLEHQKSELQATIDKITELFPKVIELLRIEQLCRMIGFTGELLKRLLNMERVSFWGQVYSPKQTRKFTTSPTSQILPK